ncbi:GmrSD restriction endonuclease domain-containing protein [Asticcacaulis tiandongensis]|uniref:GmrSD restriction endonuclease domain-containing protein n=1 Tax=Asticcacaulis tiandongensis TaxID=2565365 RepID=UPI001C641BE0|nr:DUF1524 domain-containing protein [Asticcacaulis tiandongensis]
MKAVFYNAHNEFTWQNTVLLAPLQPSDSSETVDRKLAVTARYLDIWLMRRTVNYIRVGYSAVSYAMWGLCKDIRRASLPDLVDILTSRLAHDDVTFNGRQSGDRSGLDDLRVNQFSRRYIYHLLARVTSYVDVQAGKPDLFAQLVDRERPNPCDIEHIYPDAFDSQSWFTNNSDFQNWRNHVAGLLLLSADVNRSYQGKAFADKSPHYVGQNLYAASLTAGAYEHQPQFRNFIERSNLAFRPYTEFGPEQQSERREVLRGLVEAVWSPEWLRVEAGL